jgi:endonuclease YncB( thermonuclease family)
MRYLLSIIFTLSLCPAANAQFKFEYEKECGSPFSDGEIVSRKGKITQIIDGNTVVFQPETKRGIKKIREFTVHLAGIDSSVNEEFLRDFLLENVLNKKGEVSLNPQEDESERFGIIWWAGGYGDLNRYLLKNGLADFIQPERTPAGNYYTVCVYKQLAKEAKEKKVGIWAK